ncbi:MAG: glutathione S-transferase family protein [Alphaproteobacteria bacterium]|nr:glutathione S-transferase family protein [Alphaproteobacteria bacterium]
MHKFTHYRLCPRSRSLRLAAGELGIAMEPVEQQPWDIGPDFLALNPAGELPVLEIEGGPILCGVYAAAEFMCETLAAKSEASVPLHLMPPEPEDRAEVRRLIDWFHNKLDREVTRELLFEKVYARMTADGGQSPNAEILRVARANLRYHLSYISFLSDQRSWLAGDNLSFADLAAAGQISSLDYLDEVPWDDHPVAKSWYMRIKSRPSFRAILADRIAGMPPPARYADLDF